MENSMAVSQKIKHRIIIWPSNSISWVHPKELKAGNREQICTPLFIAVFFSIAKRWRQLKCTQAEERISKMWYMCTMEYYSACTNTCLVKSGRQERTSIVWFHLVEVCKIVKSMETASRILVTRGLGRGKWGVIKQ